MIQARTLFIWLILASGLGGGLNAQDLPATTSTAAAPSVKPADMWEFGLNPGVAFVAGEVKPELGYGVGLHIRKALDYVFSIRVDALYARTKGENDPGDNFRQFEMNRWLSGTAYGVFTLNNFRFNRANRKSNIYAMVGAGGNSFTTEFSSSGIDGNPRQGMVDADLAPHIAAGAGIAFRVSKGFNFGIEHQAFGLFGNRNDQLDGLNKDEGVRSAFIDILNFTNITLNFNIGNKASRTEPLYWVNPMDEIMANVDERVSSRTEEALRDSDSDGVIDAIDQEPNTSPDVPVDTKGRTLDSDRDGVPDFRDKEPYYPPRAGEQVNEEGVVMNPIGGPGGGVTEERVQEMIDEALQRYGLTESGARVEEWFLPMIHFPVDSYTIKYSDYGTLSSIGRMMQNNPSLRLVIQGHTDQTGSESYNDNLSHQRASAVVDHLVNQYGIGRGRLLIQWRGKQDALVPLNSSYMNRRVEFRVAGPNEVEMDPPSGTPAPRNNGGY